MYEEKCVNTIKLTVEDVQIKDKVCHSCETINIADLGSEIVWLLSAHVIELHLQEKVIIIDTEIIQNNVAAGLARKYIYI
jgi:hypothetical protein